ncbi:MAG TPA: pitrilysin family protein [Candidatus Melainabacteria bacterium]|nr:pitrilysin family protein [Candidatus Melainabacteria bacterium]
MVNTVDTVDKVEQTIKELGIRRVTESKNVVEYALDNGLKVLFLENHTSPVITLLVVYKVGSRNEAVGYTGSTHFLEHMLFKGTKKHNAEKGNGIDDLLTQIGAYWNATTWFDRTSYFEVVPSEYLELCVELEADRMRNLLLRQEDHDSEMSVVRNEMERGENYPEEAIEKELYAIAFREHPYHHPTIGWRSDVEGVEMDRLREFYNTFYWPNNATVILVGDFDPAKALGHMHKYFGKIPKSPHPIPQVYTTEPPQEGERRFEIHRSGDLPKVWMGYHVPEASHADNYPLAVIRHILGSTYERSSRLYKKLIDSSIAAEVFARHDDLRDPALFILGATLNPDVDIEKAEKAIYEELERLAKEPVSDDELERARSANRKGTILSKADPSSLAFMLGEAESKADWHWLMEYDDKFDAVTKQDIMKAAAKYFVKSNRTVGHFYPKTGEEMPSEFAEHFEGDEDEMPAPEASIEAKPEEINVSEFLNSRPPVAKVKAAKSSTKTPSFESRVVKEVLPNGLTLLLLRNPGTESIGITSTTKAGKYFSYKEPGALPDFTADLMTKGSKHYGKIQIAEILENMGIAGSLEFSVDNYRMSFGSHLVADDLPQFTDLLADVMRNPLFLEEELAKTKIEWRARLTEALSNTRLMAWNAVRRSLYHPDHPFYEQTYEEQLQEIDVIKPEDLSKLHARLFGPKGTILTLVGDMDVDKTIALMRDKFGDWHGNEPLAIDIPQVKLPAKGQRIDIQLKDKRSTDLIMAHTTELQRNSQDFYAAKLANAALGQDTITSRLGQVVRDKAGLTYGIYSSFSDTAYGAAPWSISLSVNPANLDRSLALVSEVVQDYLKNGITKDELAKETGRALGTFKVGLSSSLGIARALTEFEFLGLGAKELDRITDHYLSLTKEKVDAAARHYFHPDKAVTVASGTF